MKLLLIYGVLIVCLVNGISGYTVTGNKINDPTGASVTIRGIDRPSFEWVATGEQASLADYTLMKNWGANVVRISTNQDFWLASSSYATTIDQQIAWVTQLGMGVILDLHWNNGAQQNMADRNSITFWSQVATRYKGNAWVMFELYNEPHDVTWSQWLNGDATYAGMQQMYDAVRAAGSNNLVIVCGLNWAFDLSGVSSGYKLTGSNIAYATHPYDYPGKQMADWPAAFGNLAATYPVIMTEFGQYCATNTYVQDLLTYAESLGIHWTAWAWYVSGCAFPSIIADWTGTPSSGVGVIVKNFLAGKGTTGPLPTYSPTSSPTTGGATQATPVLAIYSDGVASGWQDWSWSTSYSLSDTAYVRSGSKAIKFELVSFQGVYLHATSPISIGSYNQLEFYVNGGTSSKSASAASVKLYGSAGTAVGNSVSFTSAPTANQWSQISIPITSFGVAASTAITGFVFQSNVDTPSAGFIWIDDVSFVPASASSTTTAPTTKPTSAPPTAPTTKPTTAPTTKPIAPVTATPTTAPTSAPTAKPTSPATAAPTSKPTTAPTPNPTSAATPNPTTAPIAPTTAPTYAPSPAPGNCNAASVSIVQTAGASWQSDGQTVTQYTVVISNACNQRLVGLTLTASNWNAINYWNIVPASSGGTNVFNLPSYASATSSTPFEFGYQNVGGQASFSLSGATFQ